MRGVSRTSWRTSSAGTVVRPVAVSGSAEFRPLRRSAHLYFGSLLLISRCRQRCHHHNHDPDLATLQLRLLREVIATLERVVAGELRVRIPDTILRRADRVIR